MKKKNNKIYIYCKITSGFEGIRELKITDKTTLFTFHFDLSRISVHVRDFITILQVYIVAFETRYKCSYGGKTKREEGAN